MNPAAVVIRKILTHLRLPTEPPRLGHHRPTYSTGAELVADAVFPALAATCVRRPRLPLPKDRASCAPGAVVALMAWMGCVTKRRWIVVRRGLEA